MQDVKPQNVKGKPGFCPTFYEKAGRFYGSKLRQPQLELIIVSLK